MRINIAATHRFHLLDLARELEKQGHDVRFYSYVPTKRCMSFGLRKECCKSMLWIALPFLILSKIFPKSNQIIYIRNSILDWYLSCLMRPCDMFIFLGSVYRRSVQTAKCKYNAITILEWGSKHIIEQLKMFNKLDTYPAKLLDREVVQYEHADYISIPTLHVKESFLKYHVDEWKLIVNPYGVDLKQFHPTRLSGRYDIIMVGGWRYEKGCDLLINVCRKYHYSLLHVGAIVNLDFPESPYMHHVDAVNQNTLITYYSQARIFVLPSRSDGFGMVLSQALACGLPIVCSKETGGRDLKNLLSDKKWIIEMQDFSVEDLNRCIKEALLLSKTQTGKRNYAHDDIYNLTWEAYGKRYNMNIERVKNHGIQ